MNTPSQSRFGPIEPRDLLDESKLRGHIFVLLEYVANHGYTEGAKAGFDSLVGDLMAAFTVAAETQTSIPEKVADALREACYVPGHFDKIKHLNYCRWCHYEASHPHGNDCVMRLFLPETPK